MSWKQILLVIKKSETDLVSEVLMGLGSISITYTDALDDAIYEPPVGQTPLWDNVKLSALFSSKTDQKIIEASILEICNISVINTINLDDRIWEDECQKDFPLMRFGKKIWVCPSWDEVIQTPKDAIIINMDPGLAFGTGSHHTTRLCLEYLDANPPINLNVIDFGCGTGILAIAAAKLGAAAIIAIDNDSQAVTSCKQNVMNNNCEKIIKIVRLQSEINFGSFDLIIANILANPIIELSPLFISYLSHNGKIILSGILEEQVNKVIDCYSENFTNIEVSNQNEWFRISCTKIE